MVRVLKELFPRQKLRRASDKRLYIWLVFWFLVSSFLLGELYSIPKPKAFPIPPFDIRLDGNAK